MPPLDALRAFEAAARHLSFTRAADEIRVTQGAVSHRIKDLELQLQARLFHRRARGLVLTGEGETLAAAVRRCLDEIAGGIARLDAGPSGDLPLRIGAPPCFAGRWLVPRLAAFRERHPETALQVAAGCGPDELRAGAADVAVLHGRGPYPDLHAEFLMVDAVLPVCSPTLLAELGPGTFEDLERVARLPLLHDARAEADGGGADWASWFTHAGRPDLTCALEGQRFSDAALVLEAAASGLGLALGRTSLLARDLASGRLAAPLALPAPTRFSYWLACPPEAAAAPRVRAFRAWLLERARDPAGISPVGRSGGSLRLLEGTT